MSNAYELRQISFFKTSVLYEIKMLGKIRIGRELLSEFIPVVN